jgi:hypothetical protein
MDKQEIAQIIELLLAMREDMKAHQARMDADSKDWREEMEASRNTWRKEMMAYQGTIEARLKEEEPASVDMTPEVAHEQEVPLEDAVVMPVGERRKRRWDRRNLAAGRRQKGEEQNLDARRRGKQQDLVAVRRGTTRRAAVARRRRILFTKDTTREFHGFRKILVAARRGTTRCAGLARRKKTGNKEIENPGARWQLRLRNEKTADRISWKTHEKTRLEIARQIVDLLLDCITWNIGHCEGVDPFRSAKSKEVRRAVYGEAPATQGVLSPLV